MEYDDPIIEELPTVCGVNFVLKVQCVFTFSRTNYSFFPSFPSLTSHKLSTFHQLISYSILYIYIKNEVIQLKNERQGGLVDF